MSVKFSNKFNKILNMPVKFLNIHGKFLNKGFVFLLMLNFINVTFLLLNQIVKDLFMQKFIITMAKKDISKSVLVKYPDGTYAPGVMTSQNLQGIPRGLIEGEGELCSVLFFWTLQMGGMTRFVRKDRIIEIDIPPKQWMKMTLAGFAVGEDEVNENLE